MKLWRHIFALAVFALCAIPAYSQTTECPANMVCISPEAARKALENADLVTALRTEILTLKQAILDQREITIDTKIALARAIGEKTGLEQSVVRLTAEVEFLNRYGRKKCAPFAICIQ